MTRKDFELIAAAFRKSLQSDFHGDPKGRDSLNGILGVEFTARLVADALMSTNPRFDRDRFLKACGVRR